VTKEEMLKLVAEKIATCTKCKELACTRTQTVPGEGNCNARIVIFSEAPGMHEDISGRPFIGQAGKLLTNIINAIGLRREDVFILNCLRCRPPKNRTPLPSEIANCKPFLELQLKIIKPKYIICFGAVAANTLLETDSSISNLRGRIYDYKNSKVVVTYHPSWILHSKDEQERASKRKLVWEDMQLLLKIMKENNE
jgi:uracil-DNA glycosylase family 4